MAIHSCRRCIWSNKINKNLVYCIFPRCVIKTVPVEKIATEKEKVIPKTRTTCENKNKRSNKNVSNKTKKTL